MNYKALLTFLSIFALLLTACAGKGSAESDAEKFKHEYEIMNGQATLDGEHVYKDITIPEDNSFVYVDGARAVELLEGESGVLYMGFPECPWCRTLLPALIEAQAASGYEGNIYYYNALQDRNVLRLEDGEIVTDEAGTAEYHALVEMLKDHLGPYEGLQDDSIKRIYLPTTVFFKDGAVLSVHLDTLDSQASGYDDLTEDEYKSLVDALFEQFSNL